MSALHDTPAMPMWSSGGHVCASHSDVPNDSAEASTHSVLLLGVVS